MLLVMDLTPVAAERVPLAFEFPTELQQRAQFQAHIVTTVDGRAVARDQLLPFLWGTTPSLTCGQDAQLASQPDAMCTQLCLDPGLYTITVIAMSEGETSPASNDLDVTVLGRGPCQPGPQTTSPVTTRPPVLPAPPPPPLPFHGQPNGPPPSLPTLPNMGCVTWKIEGACVCGFPPHPCVTVSYWEPAWLLEVVKRPGTTRLEVLKPVLDAVLQAAGAPVGGGGAANASGTGQTNRQYAEVHVYTYPQVLGGPCTACAPSAGAPVIHYASELDAASWRPCKAVSPLALLLKPVGVWGNTYPRCGSVIHGSAVVASGLQAYRGLDIAFQPVTPPPNADAHVITSPSGGTSTCMQLAWPIPGGCMPAGLPPLLWEHGKGSVTGEFIWLVWKKRRCCIDTTPTCGITLPGVGGQGQNICVLPSTP